MSDENSKADKIRWKKWSKNYWKPIAVAFGVVTAVAWGGATPTVRFALGFGTVAAFAFITFFRWRRAMARSIWPRVLFLLSVAVLALVVLISIDADLFRLVKSGAKDFWKLPIPEGIETDVPIEPKRAPPQAVPPPSTNQLLDSKLNELIAAFNESELMAMKSSIQQAQREIAELRSELRFVEEVERRLTELERLKSAVDRENYEPAKKPIEAMIDGLKRAVEQDNALRENIIQEILDRVREKTYVGLVANSVSRTGTYDWRGWTAYCLQHLSIQCEVPATVLLQNRNWMPLLDTTTFFFVPEYTTIHIGKIYQLRLPRNYEPNGFAMVIALRDVGSGEPDRAQTRAAINIYLDGDPEKKPIDGDWMPSASLLRMRAGSGAPGTITVGVALNSDSVPPIWPPRSEIISELMSGAPYGDWAPFDDQLRFVVIPRRLMPIAFRTCVGVSCI